MAELSSTCEFLQIKVAKMDDAFVDIVSEKTALQEKICNLADAITAGEERYRECLLTTEAKTLVQVSDLRIWQKRSGDWKDEASLLRARVREVEIERIHIEDELALTRLSLASSKDLLRISLEPSTPQRHVFPETSSVTITVPIPLHIAGSPATSLQTVMTPPQTPESKIVLNASLTKVEQQITVSNGETALDPEFSSECDSLARSKFIGKRGPGRTRCVCVCVCGGGG